MKKSLGSMLIGLAILLFGILVMVKVNTDQEGAFLCKFVEASPTLAMEECPAHESNTSWLLLTAFAISFLVLGMGLYIFFLPINTERNNPLTTEIDTSNLTEEEQKIHEMIKLNQGSLYQSDIIKQTGLSKVKVSRILDRMEGKGIIDRKRRGMTNIVILKGG